MVTLYVVRGIGSRYVTEDVVISPDLESTWLFPYSEHGRREMSWTSTSEKYAWNNTVCYDMFSKLTGITLEPGEYTTIQVKELP